MATDIDICNLALAHLGEDSITALTDGSVRANACALQYPITRDEVLRSHRWNFALVRATLTANTAPLFGFSYSYVLPEDCLRVVEFNDTEIDGDVGEFRIEGRSLVTDDETAKILYVRREDDYTAYDAIFIQALALKLAVALSETIRGTTGKTGELLAAYERYTAPQARRIDANEGKRRKGMLPFLAGSTFLKYREVDA